MSYRFLMAGGGTGGHIFPALAVARLLRERGHDVLFAGTPEGMEARLVPEAGFRMEPVRIGGFNRAGLRKQVRTSFQLPVSLGAATLMIGRFRPHAVFSMGGYVAGPVALAAVLRRVPLIIMEPNAVPGVTNRRLASFSNSSMAYPAIKPAAPVNRIFIRELRYHKCSTYRRPAYP